jgi:hypothetical protein
MVSMVRLVPADIFLSYTYFMLDPPEKVAGTDEMIHRFTILIPDVRDDVLDRIAGQCPDTLSGSSEGRAYVDFSRQSDSLGSAIDSAIADLTSIGVTPLGVHVDETAGVS